MLPDTVKKLHFKYYHLSASKNFDFFLLYVFYILYLLYIILLCNS